MSEDVVAEINKEITGNKLVIFMKGTPEQPMCGFSARATEVLREAGYPFKAIDVLAVPGFRATLPQVSKWPTFPQIFLNGKLIGGCDIIVELAQKGELKTVLAEAFKGVA